MPLAVPSVMLRRYLTDSVGVPMKTLRKLLTVNTLVVALLLATVVMQARNMYQQRAPVGSSPLQKAPAESTVDITSAPSMGSSQANVVLIEFSDYECPFCQRYATTTFHELKTKYVDTGKVRYAFLNNPLDMHQNAQFLAELALCAGEQGRYWDVHERLFKESPKSRDEAMDIVKGTSVEAIALTDCLQRPAIGDRIKSDAAVARKLGLNGTPSFALGTVAADGKVRLTSLIRGNQPLETFDEAIRELM